MGFRMENSSPALSPSPSAAKARIDHTAPCVYWPPFSRTPGRYPFTYPGSTSEWSNGGVNSRTSPSPRRTRYSSTAAIARSGWGGSAAPDRTLHDWAIESIRHSCLLYTSDAADDLLCVDLG